MGARVTKGVVAEKIGVRGYFGTRPGAKKACHSVRYVVQYVWTSGADPRRLGSIARQGRGVSCARSLVGGRR